MAARCEKGVTTWVSVFSCASEDFDFVSHHKRAWLMIGHFGDIHQICNAREETYVVEGSPTAVPVEHDSESEEVGRAVPVDREGFEYKNTGIGCLEFFLQLNAFVEEGLPVQEFKSEDSDPQP